MDSRGLAGAAAAFFIWGGMPLYVKFLQAVPELQITANRLVWGCVVALAWLAVRGELGQVKAAMSDPSTRWRLLASATLISVNWLAFVWGVANDRALEASLGYFINPLVNVALGVIVLSERLNRIQWASVATAGAAVAYLTWNGGGLPWIALTVALSFGLYGLVRKLVRVEALAGFAVETLWLLPLGAGFLIWCELAGTAAFMHRDVSVDVMLMLGGPFTAIPLVLFAFGARRVPYSTVGLLQYIAPTVQLALAVFVFDEPFTRERAIGFTLIWIALALYAADGIWRSRKVAILVR